VTSEVRTIIRSHVGGDESLLDFSEVCKQFPIVEKLNNRSYYVESLEQYLPIEALVADPPRLDEARALLRRKGEQCLQEAQRLDVLYESVLARAAQLAEAAA